MSELAIADGLLLEMLEEHAGDEGWAFVFNGGSWLLLQALEELGLVERRSDAPPSARLLRTAKGMAMPGSRSSGAWP